MKKSIKSMCVAALLMSVASAVPLSAATVSVLPTFEIAKGVLPVSKTRLKANHHSAKAVRRNQATRFAKTNQSGRGSAKGGFVFAANSGSNAGPLQNISAANGSVATFLVAAGGSQFGRAAVFHSGKPIKSLIKDDDGDLGGPVDPILVVGGGDTDPAIDTLPPSPVPLPGAAGLMLIGLMALGAAAKARRT